MMRLACLSTGIWLLIAQAAQAEGTICSKTVRWFDDAPYSYRSAQGEIRGLNVELAQAALKQMGCEAQFVELPWARALVELENGRLDVLPGALKKPDREAYAHFSRPTNRSPNVLFARRDAVDRYTLRQLADLAGTDFRLGAQIDVSYGASYDQLLGRPDFKSRISPLSTRRSAWRMIEKNRLDGVIADEVTGLLELQQMGLDHLVIKTGLVVSGEASRFAFSKKSITPEFVQAFDKAFTSLLADGRFKEIAERHLPCPVAVDKLGCR